jgi:hypothetical protein
VFAARNAVWNLDANYPRLTLLGGTRFKLSPNFATHRNRMAVHGVHQSLHQTSNHHSSATQSRDLVAENAEFHLARLILVSIRMSCGEEPY